MEIFEFIYMRKVFAVGILLAVVVPCIGMVVNLRRLSMIGDALSHSSLAGVALGLLFGFDPLIGAVASCIFAALAIEGIRRYLPKFSEMSVAIIMSSGIGIAGFLTGLLKIPANFNAFLFGSIDTISNQEFLVITIMSIIVLGLFFLLYKQLFYISFDEQAARLSGVRVKAINFIFTIMTAVTVSIASKFVGALIVSSIMVLPVACAMQLNKGYKWTLIFSCMFAVIFTIIGIFLAYYQGLKASGTIVLLSVIAFVVIIIVKFIVNKIVCKRCSDVKECLK